MSSIREGIFFFTILLLSNSHLNASSIPEIVAKTKPAVVEIVAMDEKGSPTTLGTGFFISSDGLVVTNFHVIKGATSLSAVNNNGAIFLFERVVAQPTGVDLAILKFRASDVLFLELGKSATTVEGQKVIVIGNPTGLTGSVSDGIISAFREKRSLIQITAPISPGSSGSPVMNKDGQVIGVATLQSVEGQNLNFAISVEKVSAALVQPPREQSSGPTPPTPTSTSARVAKGFFDMGEAHANNLDFDEAISDYNESIRQDPNVALAYLGRGNAYLNKSNFDKAISDYNEAIRLKPNVVHAYNNRGLAYDHKGLFDEAISDYNEAIQMDPNPAHTYNNRGLAYEHKGLLDKAISDYDAAIYLDPDYAPAYENRAKAYLRTGNQTKADADFAEARRLKAAQ